MQLVFAQLQSDCEHVADRALLPGRLLLVVTQDALYLVRVVFAEAQPSALQAVAYRVVQGRLLRSESAAARDLRRLDALWQAAAGRDARADGVALQSGVAAMAIRVWRDDGNGWRAPGVDAAGTDNAARARGVEVSLRFDGAGAGVRKAFLLGPA